MLLLGVLFYLSGIALGIGLVGYFFDKEISEGTSHRAFHRHNIYRSDCRISWAISEQLPDRLEGGDECDKLDPHKPAAKQHSRG